MKNNHLCIKRAFSLVALCLISVMLLSSCRGADEFGSEPERLIENSRITFRSMLSDNQYPGLVDLATRAKAVIIIPNMIRAAFFIGGRGGNAVMLVRDKNGMWSAPAFYTVGGGSFGLQFGGEAAEIVIVVMTDKGFRSLFDYELKIGGDAGISVGEIGKGVNASTGLGLKSDMYAFARSQGLYAGISLDGAVVSPRKLWNEQFYGKGTTPKQILIDRSVTPAAPSAVQDIQAAMP